MMILRTALSVLLASLTFSTAWAQPQGGAPVQVFAADVAMRQVSDRIEALGTLRANETVTLTSNVTDTVMAIRFEDGQRVKAGDVLVEMTNREQSAQLKEMQANVSEARRQVQRLKPLVEQGAASKSALDSQTRAYQAAQAQLDAVKARLQDRLITAPFDGVVGLRNISVGTLLQPGTAITTLDEDSVMKLDFSVPSIFLADIKPGTLIEARTRAYPEKIFAGEIQSVASQIDPASRSITARAIIPNDEQMLKPGLLMTVTLKKNERTAITIPELSLIVEGRDHFVYVIESGKAVKRKVEIGAREPGHVEIVSGLETGHVIVTDGIMKLADGMPVNVRAKREGDESLSDLLNKTAPAAQGNDR